MYAASDAHATRLNLQSIRMDSRVTRSLRDRGRSGRIGNRGRECTTFVMCVMQGIMRGQPRVVNVDRRSVRKPYEFRKFQPEFNAGILVVIWRPMLTSILQTEES